MPKLKSKKVKVTVIDDRTRTQLEDCPFKGVFIGRKIDAPQRCNINETSSPICVGEGHEDCLLQQYDRFIVERAD